MSQGNGVQIAKLPYLNFAPKGCLPVRNNK